MPNLKSYIIAEGLYIDDILFKLNTWYNRKDAEKASFHAMMRFIIANNPVRIEDYEDCFNHYFANYARFVDFVLDNVDGLKQYDSLYIMKKITDLLKANKSLEWNYGNETYTNAFD